ncbi:MAG: hypothetical protein L0226_05830 [Acidobacteria bacterium]|nr:hypothetical protein [Acidobacteriota bacterium]
MTRRQKTKINEINYQRVKQPSVALRTRNPEDAFLQLQRTIGNQAVGRFLQAKLNVNQPDDKYEKEADWAAEQVMRMPETASSNPSNGLLQPHRALALSPLGPTILARKKPDDIKAVHKALFVTSPIGESCKKWRDKATKASPKTTGEEMVDEFRKNLEEDIKKRPLSVVGEVTAKTSESEIDTIASEVNQKILKKFGGVIKTPLTDTEVQDRVKILAAEKTKDPEFIKQWLANKLNTWTTIGEYCIDEDDKRFQKVLNDILADESMAKSVRTLASRQSAFFEGEAASRTVHIHKGMEAAKAESTLIHELVHFYAHPDYRQWNAKMIVPRYINEGFAEFLAREVEGGSARSSYEDRYEFIRDKVAKHVSVDDIASAYFAGEVWKVENISKVAKELFGVREKEKKKAK